MLNVVFATMLNNSIAQTDGALQDWTTGFHYWDDRKSAPGAGMRENLFGSEPLR